MTPSGFSDDPTADESAEAEVADVDDAAVLDDEEADGSDSGKPKKPPRKRAKQVPRTYPRKTLEECLIVAEAIRDKNGGNAWATAEVAAAVGISRGNSSFFYLVRSSREFGLTNGTRDQSEISLTDRGRSVVYPQVPEERDAALREAFFGVDIFAKVVRHYKGSRLPEEPFRSNTLTSTFGLDETLVPEFVALFEANCAFLGIGDSYSESDGVQTPPSQFNAGSEVVALPAKPSTTAGRVLVCFVAMPFTERDERHPTGFFEEVLNSVFVPAITSAGFEVKTAKIQGSDVIQSTIVTELLAADIVLADLTEHNPNVLFELGMRMNADLPVALVRAMGTGAIFDVDHMLRVEDYSPNLWPSTVVKDVETLSAHIKATWENRKSTQTYMKILKGN